MKKSALVSNKQRRDAQKKAMKDRSNINARILRFRKTDNPETRLEIVESINRSGHRVESELSHTLGAMWLEIAMDKRFKRGQRLNFIGNSVELLEKASSYEQIIWTPGGGNAKLLLANMPVFQALALDIDPLIEHIDQAYKNTLQLGKQCIADYNTHKSTASNADKQKRHRFGVASINGLESEIAVLGLMQRQGLKLGDNDDSGWLALPAQYSENSSISRARVNRSWDVSVYTGQSEERKITYPIQVKTSRRGISKITYSPDIPLISARTDLTINGESDIPQFHIILAMDDEYTKKIGRRTFELDQRFDHLMDVVDPPVS